jgi:hypothetical protein
MKHQQLKKQAVGAAVLWQAGIRRHRRPRHRRPLMGLPKRRLVRLPDCRRRAAAEPGPISRDHVGVRAGVPVPAARREFGPRQLGPLVGVAGRRLVQV